MKIYPKSLKIFGNFRKVSKFSWVFSDIIKIKKILRNILGGEDVRKIYGILRIGREDVKTSDFNIT